MPLVKGMDLTPEQREEVKAVFINRHLAIPEFYVDDDDWINRHSFYIDKNGYLARKRNCVPYGRVDESRDIRKSR